MNKIIEYIKQEWGYFKKFTFPIFILQIKRTFGLL